MYQKAYGIIETLAPVHVGASAGEETGNLNLIFRDQFTQTGIIPGSSIRGRFRADVPEANWKAANSWYGHPAEPDPEQKEAEKQAKADPDAPQSKDRTTEARIKFEYASLLWLPVFCPGQPVVWVTCPRLLKRYHQIARDFVNPEISDIPKAYSADPGLIGRPLGSGKKVLFFNLGFLEIEHDVDLSPWIPTGVDLAAKNLVVVDDNDISMLHDMALYRQSRVKLDDKQKKVSGGAFFNVEALPEGSILVFPVAMKETKKPAEPDWQPFNGATDKELYFGGLESIGFGRCRVTLAGAGFTAQTQAPPTQTPESQTEVAA